MLNKKDCYSVSDVNNYIKTVFDTDYSLKNIKIEAELRDFKLYSTSAYFTLIDENSSLSAVMFLSYLNKIDFKPKTGDRVIVVGSITSYPKRGQYQLMVKEMYLSGDGLKLLRLMELKKKLAAEGLFTDVNHKRKINLFPKAIGLITGRGSAASKDLIVNISRRFPLCKIYTFYSLVQGENASKDLIKALKKAYEFPLDTIIIGRGGGSNEDLDAFNDEELVRTAYLSKIPIISAVGHEIDTTLIDLVADVRASTPTGAAELATIDKREIYDYLDSSKNTLNLNINNLIEDLRQKINNIKNRPFFVNPKNMYKDKINDLEHTKETMTLLINSSINKYHSDLELLKNKLMASSPINYINDKKMNLNNSKDRMKLLINTYLSNYKSNIKMLKTNLTTINPTTVLKRGFSIVSFKSGKIISNINDVNINDEIITTIDGGAIKSIITDKEEFKYGK